MLLLGSHDPRLRDPRHRAEARVAALVSDAFGGPLAGDRWLGFYGIHVRQLTLPQEGELGPDDTPVDQLREVDFLIFDRQRGFAVLEVKGGLLRRRRCRSHAVAWEAVNSAPGLGETARSNSSALLRSNSDTLALRRRGSQRRYRTRSAQSRS